MSSWEGDRVRRLRALVIKRDSVCWLCGAPGALQLDHVIPRAHGGGDELSNLRPAHAACNSARQYAIRKIDR